MELSRAARNVCEVAVVHLAERGYEGCSLNEIADRAGMRKASLYSHFRSKDDLVRAVLGLALDTERTFVAAAFAEDTGTPRGGRYLTLIHDRVNTSPDLRFLLRTAYAPPASIREDVVALYRSFNDDLRTLFIEGLPSDLEQGAQDVLVEAYLGAVDGLQVEVLYGTREDFERRRQALWTLLEAYASA